MGTKASYSKIGFTIVAGTVAIIGALIYFGGLGSRLEKLMAETYYQSEVSGLSVGSEVNFRGVKVGEVAEITFVGREYDDVTEVEAQQILIKMALNMKMFTSSDETPPEELLKRYVDHGLRATVSSSGITGISRVELNYPTIASEPAAISWRARSVYIPSSPSILQSFSDSASHVMEQLNGMDFKGAWSNVTTLVTSVSELVESANEVVETQKSALGGIMNEVEAAGAKIRELATELTENPSLLLRDRTPEELPETR